MAKLVDHAQGVEDYGREKLYRPSSSKVLAALRSQNLQIDLVGVDATHQDKAKYESKRESARTMAE